METSVIGIYKSSSDAKNAMSELMKTGISADDMQLTGGGQREASGGVTRSLKEETGVGEVFRRLYGREDTQTHAETYDRAAGQGHAILTVNAPSEVMAHRAAEVMERFGPIDVDEYASVVALGVQDEIQEGRSQSADAAMTAGPSATGTGQKKGSGRSAGPATGAAARGQQGSTVGTTASQETPDGKIHDDVQKGRPLDMRKEVRMYQRSSAAPVQRTDDSRFRSHWQNTQSASGGTYDEFDPAYRFGSESRGSERWSNKQWADAEPDLRKDWEAKNPKGMWERFKETVRYGWENPTGRYEDETRALGDRMMPGMGAEPMPGAGAGERSRPSTSVSPGTGTSTVGRPQGAAISGGMSTSGATFTSDQERSSTMSTSRDTRSGTGGTRPGQSEMESPMVSSGKQDDVQKGRSQTADAAAAAGPSGTTRAGAGGMSGSQPASVSGGGAHATGRSTRDTEDFRAHCESHWKRSYWKSGGSFDDYQPAYEYGADYADNDTITSHTWEDVEPRLRANWKSYNQDPNSWEQNKDAIRCGWEKGKQGGSGTRSGHSLRQ